MDSVEYKQSSLGDLSFINTRKGVPKIFKMAAQQISKVRQSLTTVSTLLIASLIAILHTELPSLSQSSAEGELICYLQTEDRRIIDLSKLCGLTTPTPALSVTDQQFLETYRSFLNKRSRTLPSIAAALSQLQQSPQAVVERATRICTNIKSGTLNRDQLPQGAVDSDLINIMALEYYCPELDD